MKARGSSTPDDTVMTAVWSANSDCNANQCVFCAMGVIAKFLVLRVGAGDVAVHTCLGHCGASVTEPAPYLLSVYTLQVLPPPLLATCKTTSSRLLALLAHVHWRLGCELSVLWLKVVLGWS